MAQAHGLLERLCPTVEAVGLALIAQSPAPRPDTTILFPAALQKPLGQTGEQRGAVRQGAFIDNHPG